MPRHHSRFSFIRWEECFRTGYDRFCQELWDWPLGLDRLYPPRTPFDRLPWTEQPALYGEPGSAADSIYRPGRVSVWLLISPDAEPYFDFDELDCQWEPLEAPLFWDDLGYIFWPAKSECAVMPTPLPIEDLLHQLLTPDPDNGWLRISQLNDFAAEILESCRRQSLTAAAGFYCAYDCDYQGQPTLGKFCSGHVKYLGAFDCLPHPH